MVDEKRNSITMFIAMLIILFYVLNSIFVLTETKLNAEQPKESAILFYNDSNDEDDEEENPEEETEEEPLVQCPPSRPVTPYELFEYNNNLLMKPSFRMLNG